MRAQLKPLVFFLVISNSLFITAQAQKADSLKRILPTLAEDSNKVNVLNLLAEEFRTKEPVTGAAYAREALQLSQRISFAYGEALAYYYIGNTFNNQRKFEEALEPLERSLRVCKKIKATAIEGRVYNTLGIINEMKGNYPQALNYYMNALQAFTNLEEKKKMANCRYNVANIYRYQGNYPMALKYHFEALKEREKVNDKKGMATSLNSIGLIYKEQKEPDLALKNYFASLKINSEVGDKANEVLAHNNIGVIYREKKNYKEALAHFYASQKICSAVNYEPGLADTYVNIGNVLMEQDEHGRAIENFSEAQKIHEKLQDPNGLALTSGCFSAAYLELKNYSLAVKYATQCLAISKNIGVAEFTMSAEEVLYKAYDALRDIDKAYAHYRSFIAIRDTLYSEENTKRSVQLQMNFDFDKKEAVARAGQERKDAIAKAEAKRQRFVLLAISGFGLLVLGFAIFAYRSFLQKKRANHEISHQKNLIEEKQKEILDSIYYARRIQRSLMPPEKYIAKHLARLNG